MGPTSTTSSANTSPTNVVTIDDELGDSATGALPVYAPPERWTQGAQCPVCLARPDAGKAFDGTWHDTSIFSTDPGGTEMNVTMKFTGSTIQAYCILANSAAANLSTLTNLTFSIDGSQVGSYLHASDGSNTFQYDVLVYANESVGTVSNSGQTGRGRGGPQQRDDRGAEHTFMIHVPKGTNTSLILFDYARYSTGSGTLSNTTSTATTSSIAGGTSKSASSSSSTAVRHASSKAAIAGGVIAGSLVFLALLFVAFLWRRRQSRFTMINNGDNSRKKRPKRQPASHVITPWHLPPPEESHSHPERPTKGAEASGMRANPIVNTTIPAAPLASSSENGTVPIEPVNQQAELMRVLDDRRRTLARLRNVRSGSPDHPSVSSSSSRGLMREGVQDQIEELTREVESLREMIVVMSLRDAADVAEAPPSYFGR